ncbi:MAG: ABC transporter substrate-binding protein [Gammaproteobacteria bacterium]
MKVKLFAVLMIVFTSAPLTATAAYAPHYPGNRPPMPAQAPAATPAAILKEGVNKLTAYIRSGQQNRKQALGYLERDIAPYFDFAYMTRLAAGPQWRRMNQQQRTAMQRELTRAFLNTLAQNLTSYSNQSIRFFTPRGQQRRGEVTVSAWIVQPDGPPTKLDFRFYKSKSGWKIFDVTAAGNSAVVYYRDYFKRMQRQPAQSYRNN